MDIEAYWKATLAQDKEAMRTYFHKNAIIRWHNTNEAFTVDEFLIANCEYPGIWDGEIENCVGMEDLMITAVHVYAKEESLSFHVVSFIQMKQGKIAAIDEYWGDDDTPPTWRLEKRIGRKIQ